MPNVTILGATSATGKTPESRLLQHVRGHTAHDPHPQRDDRPRQARFASTTMVCGSVTSTVRCGSLRSDGADTVSSCWSGPAKVSRSGTVRSDATKVVDRGDPDTTAEQPHVIAVSALGGSASSRPARELSAVSSTARWLGPNERFAEVDRQEQLLEASGLSVTHRAPTEAR